MPKKVAFLTIEKDDEPDSEPTIVDLTSDVIISRLGKPFVYKDRVMPVETTGVNTYILADHKNVSRIHARINPLEGGNAEIWDMNSRNGTKLFGRELTHAILEPDDIIHVGNISITYDERVADPKYLSRQALLIGNQFDLDGVHNNIDSMVAALGDRGFQRDDITVVLDKEATKKRVLTELDIAREKSYEKSLFVFYYSGHGTKKGSLFLYNPAGLFMPSRFRDVSAQEVCKKLKVIQGNKVAVIDACFAGQWKNAYNNDEPDNTLIMASTKEDAEAYYRKTNSLLDDKGYREYRGAFTGAVVKSLRGAVNDRNNFIDLKALKPEINTILGKYELDDDKQMMTLIGQTIVI